MDLQSLYDDISERLKACEQSLSDMQNIMTLNLDLEAEDEEEHIPTAEELEAALTEVELVRLVSNLGEALANVQTLALLNEEEIVTKQEEIIE